MTKNTLGAYQRLNAGEGLTSTNGAYELRMQSDGNLVLYSGASAIWQSGTAGSGATYAELSLQLYIRKSNTNYVWYTPMKGGWFYTASRAANSSLGVQDDGNIVITTVEPVWNTVNGGQITNGTNVVIMPGTVMPLGTEYRAGEYRLVLQGDGNLVTYRGSSVIWASYTQNKGAAFAQMQDDGNFVIYNAANKALWNTGTSSKPGAYLAFQVDGNLVVYQPIASWARFGVPITPPRRIVHNLPDGTIVEPVHGHTWEWSWDPMSM